MAVTLATTLQDSSPQRSCLKCSYFRIDMSVFMLFVGNNLWQHQMAGAVVHLGVGDRNGSGCGDVCRTRGVEHGGGGGGVFAEENGRL